MILCQFNIPQYDNDKQPLHNVIKLKTTELLKAFGGVTVHEAGGDWLDENNNRHREMVTVFTVAVDAPKDVLRLKAFAMKFARAAHQKALFFAVIGKAEIVDLGKENENDISRDDKAEIGTGIRAPTGQAPVPETVVPEDG